MEFSGLVHGKLECNTVTYTGEEDEFRAVLLLLVLGNEGVGVGVGKVQARASTLYDQPMSLGHGEYSGHAPNVQEASS